MDDTQDGRAETLCTLRELEARHIARALDLSGGNQRRAARMLGVTRWSLARRLRKYGFRLIPAVTTALLVVAFVVQCLDRLPGPPGPRAVLFPATAEWRPGR